ncbi:MAG TPA: amidase [Anaerolineae bacterium]|nr:amidase [Anaerolineae bacterium]
MVQSFETQLSPLANALRSGQLSLPDYLAQLEAFFGTENQRVLAFLPEEGRFDRLRHEAERLEAQYPDPASRPPLYGVPFGVKDIFHVSGFPTQAGSKLPSQILAGPEATSVTRLKQQGGLVLGKTVTTEFAYFGPGPTRNPRHLEHTPGGSSSGSAAAVAANLCPLTLGTQTIGSIVRPASFCGVVGFKPSAGRVSTAGVIPLSPTLDHIGFFTQDLAGAALAASVLCETWSESPLPDTRPVLGIPEGPYLQKASAEGSAYFNATAQKLARAGFTVRSVPALPHFEQIYAAHNTLMAAEAAAVHGEWYTEFAHLYHPKTVELIERGRQVTPAAVAEARAGRETLRTSLNALMIEQELDLWISPAAVGSAPAGLESTGNPVMNLPWTYAGLPALNLPAGTGENGLPLGLQLTGGWQQDERLLGWAMIIEQALR